MTGTPPAAARSSRRAAARRRRAAAPTVVVVGHTAREGGAELALLRLLGELRVRDARVRAVLFEDGPLVGRLRERGIQTVVIPLDRSINSATRDRLLRGALIARLSAIAGHTVRLTRAIRGSGADLVVANTLKAAVFLAVAAPLSGRRWVWHVHDRIARDYLPLPVMRALRVLAAWGPRAIVVNSRSTLATLPARARRRSVVAHPGLPPDAFEAREGAPGRVVVGMIGRISPTKGQRDFLAAAAEVRRTHPDTAFRIVGKALFEEGDYETSLRDLVETTGLGDRVEFAGWVTDPAEELRALSVLVHASPVPEPFGQVVVEAMAAGVPVVAADAGGVREILDASDSPGVADASVRETPFGLLFRAGDAHALATALRVVLDDPAAADARAARARASVRERFPIARTADIVDRAWRRAVGIPPV